MKTTNIILIILGVVLTAGIIFFYLEYSKKKKESKQNPQNNPKTDPEKKKNQSSGFSPQVAKLQAELNEKLPAGYEKLKIDGIAGPKTSAAVQFLQAQTTNTAGKSMTEIEAVKTLASKGKSVLDFLTEETPLKYTGLGMINNLFN